MSLLDLFDTRAPAERIQYVMENQSLSEEVNYLRGEIGDLQEDMLKISDAFDNIGWAPLDENEATEIPLKTVKKIAKVARAMYALNPFVKRGVKARYSYIWGRSVQFDGTKEIDDKLTLNRKKMFSPQAYEELEVVLATDGNAFTALPIGEADDGKRTVFRVPLDEITGIVANPDDKEDIWFYKREYTIHKTNSRSGQTNDVDKVEYYGSISYYNTHDNTLPRNWNRVSVRQDFIIQHTTVNKQVGWRWGLPDIAPVIFWAKAYKEYLEDNATLVKAYSRLAWQVRSGSALGVQAAAMQVMTPPTRDPMTGELRDVGGTAIGGSGNSLQAMPATGSQVDFSKGSALASAIASGLEVSKIVITSDPGEGTNATAATLDLPTLKAMEARQLVHTDRFLEIFEFWGAKVTPNSNGNDTRVREVQEAALPPKVAAKQPQLPEGAIAKPAPQGQPEGPDYVVVTWPHIQADSTKDRIAALGTAVEEGIIYKQEARKEAIEVFGFAPYKPWYELPTMADDPAGAEQAQIQSANADKEFQNTQELNKQSAIAKQGVSGGAAAKGGAQSSSNQSRNNRKQDSNNR